MFDASGRVYASHVVAAYAYAQRMGAHIVSCSFGPDTPNLQPQPYEVAEMVAQESLYSSAVTPLESKGVLLVAAAGELLCYVLMGALEPAGDSKSCATISGGQRWYKRVLVAERAHYERHVTRLLPIRRTLRRRQ